MCAHLPLTGYDALTRMVRRSNNLHYEDICLFRLYTIHTLNEKQQRWKDGTGIHDVYRRVVTAEVNMSIDVELTDLAYGGDAVGKVR